MTFAARERDVDARALVVVCMDIPTPDDLRTEPRVTHVERTRDVLGKVIAQLRASRTLIPDGDWRWSHRWIAIDHKGKPCPWPVTP